MKKLLGIVLIAGVFSITLAKPLFHFSTHVVNVYDGDTVWVQQNLSGKVVDTKIRTLGIDTPELYHTGMVVKDYKFYGCGKQAKTVASKFLLNKTVKVYSDTLAKNTGKYHRLLRYIYVPLPYKGKTIYLPYGAIMIYLGYAKVYEYEKFTYKNLYEKLQNMAKKAHRGIWSNKCIQEDKKIKEAYKKYLEQKRLKELDEKKQTTTNNLNLTCPTHRVYCSHLTTCAEAKYYYKNCGMYKLDKDGDGIPCENLCGGK